MIDTFADKALERLYYDGPSAATRKIPAELHQVIHRRLTYLRDATCLNDLRVPPANRLEALKGELAGYHSIRVNDQWRIVFRWTNDTASDIRFMDYH